MRRILKIGIPVLLVAILAVGYAGWRLLDRSLPRLDGELVVAGLSGEATIVRDDVGVVTIRATTEADVAFALGFAHGQDRFFQMDLIRRQAAGELSELFGEIAVDTDKRYRFHRFRDRARAVLARSPAADVEILENYAAGVNAGLASLGARPFEHLLLGAEPAPWRAEDSVLVVYAMFMQLNDARASKDVRRGFANRSLPE